MGSYRLTEDALHDLDRLYEFGVIRFGLSKADAYFDGLVARFQQVADHPETYPAVDEIRPGYRRSVFESHSIYYRQREQEIEIGRILGHQDIDQAFLD